jgi:2-polyprenyl-3-methyl-5-hydroxy-6-metoxy-1,4-benzoquinol methylase
MLIEKESPYMQFLLSNKEYSLSYYQSRSMISRQQSFLHSLLRSYFPDGLPNRVADVACGGGWTSIQISQIYDSISFDLYELSSVALEACCANIEGLGLSNFNLFQEDIASPHYLLSNKYSLIVCMMTLCCVERYSDFLNNIANALSENGIVILSTLFNRNHPTVDLEVTQIEENLGTKRYKVFCQQTLEKLINLPGKNFSYSYHHFDMDIPLDKPLSGGTGTYTVGLADSKYLEISGGALFQWSFIIIRRIE